MSTAADSTGDGTIDLTQVSTITVDADGSSVTDEKDLNRDGSLRDETVTTLSADGLSKTTRQDLDGSDPASLSNGSYGGGGYLRPADQGSVQSGLVERDHIRGRPPQLNSPGASLGRG